jgi:uncharacterized protein (TIGR02246 family)
MATDATAIATDVLSRMGNAWGDIEAFAALFTEDADLTHGSGRHDGGRAAIRESMGAGFAGRLKGSAMTVAVISARALRDDVVLARVSQLISGAGVELPPLVGTFVLARDGAAWRIAAIQNTPAPS